eukprot:scaffold83982_cov72-Phaeocystis_antarctica.AAC.4
MLCRAQISRKRYCCSSGSQPFASTRSSRLSSLAVVVAERRAIKAVSMMGAGSTVKPLSRRLAACRAMASAESAAGADTATPSARAEHSAIVSVRMTLPALPAVTRSLLALPVVARRLAVDNGLLDLVMAGSILLLLILGLKAGVGCLGGLLGLGLGLGLGRHPRVDRTARGVGREVWFVDSHWTALVLCRS